MIPIYNKQDYIEQPANYINIIPDKLLASISSVFSSDECNILINYSERLGYKPASLYTDTHTGYEHFNNNVRDNLRSMTDDSEFVSVLEERIWYAIPKIYKGRRYHSINERLRFLKYDGSGHFQRHTDGAYSDTNRISLITILIYLNEEYNGGFTTFFPNSYTSNGFVLKPETGMVCLMDQGISHEVPELISGIKYVIRTELMYYF